MERNHVRLPQKLRQLHIVKAAFRIREFIVCQHAHPEALADTGKNSADLARADHAHGLAVQIEARQPGQAEIEVARADIRLVRVPVDRQQQRHRVLRHRVGRVRRDAEDVQLAEAGFGIHIVEARAAQRNDPNAQIIKFVYNLLIHRVVDEHAYAVKALCQLHGVLAEPRLKILDLNVRSGGMLVKAGLVIGLRIKKCKFHIALHLHDFYGASVVLSARHVKHHFLQNKRVPSRNRFRFIFCRTAGFNLCGNYFS